MGRGRIGLERAGWPKNAGQSRGRAVQGRAVIKIIQCPIAKVQLTWFPFAEDQLSSRDGMVGHALGQAEQLAVIQAEEDGDLAQGLEAPHVLDWPQHTVKGLALQHVAGHCCAGCHCPRPAQHMTAVTTNGPVLVKRRGQPQCCQHHTVSRCCSHRAAASAVMAAKFADLHS